MCGSMADIQSVAAEIRRGKKRRRKKKNKPQHENIMVCLFHRATIKMIRRAVIVMLPSPGAQPPVSVAPREHGSDDTASTPRDDSPAAASSLDPASSDNKLRTF